LPRVEFEVLESSVNESPSDRPEHVGASNPAASSNPSSLSRPSFDPKSSSLPNPRFASENFVKPSRMRIGVLDPRRIRLVVFGAIAASMFGAAGLCILSVWNYVARDVSWRAIATLVIVIATTVAFTLVNEFFGATIPPLGASTSFAGMSLATPPMPSPQPTPTVAPASASGRNPSRSNPPSQGT